MGKACAWMMASIESIFLVCQRNFFEEASREILSQQTFMLCRFVWFEELKDFQMKFGWKVNNMNIAVGNGGSLHATGR